MIQGVILNTLTQIWAYMPIPAEKKSTWQNTVFSCFILIILRLPFFYIFDGMKPVWLFTLLRILPPMIFLKLYKGIDWKRCLYFSCITWVGFTISSTLFSSPTLFGLVDAASHPTASTFLDKIVGTLLGNGAAFILVTLLTRLIPLARIKEIGSDRLILLAYVVFCESYLIQLVSVTRSNGLGELTDQFSVYFVLMQTVVMGGMLLFERYMSVVENRTREQMLDLAGEYQYAAWKERQSAETDVRRLHHDMKNHLLAIQGMKNDPEQVDRYIEQMLDGLKSFEVLRRTGNELLDGLLSEKIRIAAGYGVELTAELDFRSCSYIDSFDVCTIFGNILDNAIEAAAKVQSPCQRIIRLQGALRADRLMITCTNPYTGKLKPLGDLFATGKADAKLHGIGLSNVKRSAEKYGGEVLIDTEQTGIFKLILMLPAATPSAE